MSTANHDIRAVMLKYGVTQADLGKMLGKSQPEISAMLNGFELASSEKRRIKEIIRREAKPCE